MSCMNPEMSWALDDSAIEKTKISRLEVNGCVFKYVGNFQPIFLFYVRFWALTSLCNCVTTSGVRKMEQYMLVLTLSFLRDVTKVNLSASYSSVVTAIKEVWDILTPLPGITNVWLPSSLEVKNFPSDSCIPARRSYSSLTMDALRSNRSGKDLTGTARTSFWGWKCHRSRLQIFQRDIVRKMVIPISEHSVITHVMGISFAKKFPN